MRYSRGVVGFLSLVGSLAFVVQACSDTPVAIDGEDSGAVVPVVDAQADRAVTPVKDAGKDTATPPPPPDADVADTSVVDANKADAADSATATDASDGGTSGGLPILIVSQTAGGKVAQTLVVDAAQKLPVLTSTYCPTTLSAASQGIYTYVLVRNTGAQAVNVTLTNMSAAQTGIFAAYAGNTPPAAAGRLACQDHVGVDKFTITIPGNGEQLVYVGAVTSTAVGNFPIEANTNFIGAETPVAVDHTLEISPTLNGVVNQPITFSESKFLPVSSAPGAFATPAVYTGANACPVTKFGEEYPYRYVRLTNAGATARTVNLITTSVDDDSYLAVYPDVPLSTSRSTCTGTYNDDCTNTDYNACLTGVTVPAAGSVVVYIGGFTDGGLYPTNNLRVTTAN